MGQPAALAATSHRIAIVGTGFAGLGMAIKLKAAGIDDFVILEKAGDVGGTWRDNNYPGCACDVQSHLYSFSFEPNPDWSRMFAPQAEIHAYLRHCTQKYDLHRHIRFKRHVTAARYDERSGTWTVESGDAEEVAAYLKLRSLKPGDAFPHHDPKAPLRQRHVVQSLVLGVGGLSTPAYPDLPGLENFTGRRFHSQDWDHAYDLTGKCVAVIGTGASAIQFVPKIQPKVALLDLYQRTPPWIIGKPDRAITRFEQLVFRIAPPVQKLLRGAIWTMLESRVLGFTVHPRIMKLVQRAAVGHIRRQIPKPELRAKVTPDYTIGCKRILISDDYYPALAQSNVDVVTAGIREVRARSIVTADGTERPVDCIIFGTGFRAVDPVPPGLVHGRGGQDLAHVWKNGPEAYKGTTVAGFPNLFMIVGPNVGLGHSSMVYMIESQIAYVIDALQTMQRQALKAVEPRAAVQASFNARLQSQLSHAIWAVGGCRSWYVHPSGKNVTLWPGFTWKFRRETRRFDVENYLLVGQDLGEQLSTGTSGSGAIATSAGRAV
jgi:cation diffusion facilitator CzcD-associated flavoprotein CzcO